MEGSESEKVFASLNLNPQLFVHEVLNTVDDVVDGGFAFFEQQALALLGNTGEDNVNELSECISSIRSMIQEVLDKRLSMWEKYCLRHCFAVPEGFSLLKSDTAGDVLMDHTALSDAEMDNQIDSLREKLLMVGKESSELQKEVQTMWKNSLVNNSCAVAISEALQQYEQNSVHDMFQETLRMTSKLNAELENLKIKRSSEFERLRTERIYDLEKDVRLMLDIEGLPSVDLQDAQEFIAALRNM